MGLRFRAEALCHMKAWAADSQSLKGGSGARFLGFGFRIRDLEVVVCGLWCVVCGLWFLGCVFFWFMVCVLWFVVCGLRFVFCGWELGVDVRRCGVYEARTRGGLGVGAPHLAAPLNPTL